MRMLHTSDWHLGATLEAATREPEQALFLAWLQDLLAERAVDLLVVAGDVFQQAQPSAEALGLYYGFLAGLARRSAVRQVVVVGGNHDSPSRLDAPRQVLSALDVHVVGGLDPDWDRLLCPVRDQAGEVRAVVAAVPFIHEYRLGIRTTGRAPGEIADEFRQAFAGLYRTLADRAEARWPGVPLVATGHLTCGIRPPASERGSEIHQVGTIGALPADIFDPRFAYVALGHLHRSFQVADSRAWYAGSPVALSEVEAATRRQVLLVDVERDADAPPLPAAAAESAGPAAGGASGKSGQLTLDWAAPGGVQATAGGAGSAPPGVSAPGGRVQVERLDVPSFRDLVALRGRFAELVERLRTLQPSAHGLAPYVMVELIVDSYDPEASHRLKAAVDELPAGRRPVLVRLIQQQPAPAVAAEGAGTGGGPSPALRDLTPEQVFLRLVQARRGDGQAPSDDLLIAFRQAVATAQGQEAAAATSPAVERGAAPAEGLLAGSQP